MLRPRWVLPLLACSCVVRRDAVSDGDGGSQAGLTSVFVDRTTSRDPEPADAPARADPSPEPSLDSSPDSSSPACVIVSVGLSLQALPQPASPSSIDMYTRSRAEELRELLPDAVEVELLFSSGITVFDAKLFGASLADTLTTCETAVAAFIPTVPGRPGTRSSGGSVLDGCRACEPTD